jgi:SAM-dependent methyltransferase
VPDGPQQATTSETLFDRGAEYDAMLDRGLKLTGESKAFYLRGRLALLAELLSEFPPARRILDFGCGIGDTTVELARLYPGSRVVGVDTAASALEYAREIHANERVSYSAFADLEPEAGFDLCYTNGVFHHIPEDRRDEALRRIGGLLRPGGFMALFENNPWNPGTRLVMSRIPFDRDAKTLTPTSAGRMLESNHLSPVISPQYLFFFPAPLRALRPLERHLRRWPLGGQYLLMARKPEDRPPQR